MDRKEPAAMAGGEYLLLRPERASLTDAIAILFSSRLGRRRSVESSRRREADLESRWVIFVSLLLQMLLVSVAKPLAWVGSLLEMWLNTLSFNGGFWGILPKFLWGKVVIPDNRSRTYVSTMGNLDTRMMLDGKISPGDNRYSGAVAIMAAKMAYENKAFTKTIVSNYWKKEFVGAYDFWNDSMEQYGTHAFIMLDKSTNPETYIVSFRGTQPFNAYEWCLDIDISWYEIRGIGRAHAGFMEALGMQKMGWPKEIDQGTSKSHVAYYFLKKKLRDLLEQNKTAKFVVTGHSLGGALAIMFPAILAMNQEEWLLERLEGVYTFGQPRVGDERFGDFVMKHFTKYGIKYMRYVYCNDVVVRLPADVSGLLYRHFGTPLYFNGLYQGKSCQQEPNRNHFSLLATITMFLNAVWELIRSYIIPIVYGWDYAEGWFLGLLRLFGLVLPGLSEHVPQDYDNAARLGSLAHVLPKSGA